MKKKVARILSIFLSAVLAASVFAGCGTKKDASGTAGSTQAGSNGKDASAVSSVYPIKTNYKLKVWGKNNSPDICSSYNELPWMQEATKRTGIQVEWMHPPADDIGGQLNLIIASGDLPDIILSNWIAYKGGPEKAITENIIIPLNDVIDKYCPNFKAFINNDPDMGKIIKTDTGKIFNFPQVRSAPGKDSIYNGPIVRKDWLDELGLKMPETMDDWYTMLKAFKDKKGASAPLTMQGKTPRSDVGFIGSYGLFYKFYRDSSQKVKYGAMQPEYKEYLTTMNKWYREGLLDPEYGSVSSKTETTKITEGKSGASYGLGGGQMGTWNNTMMGKNPTFKMVAAPVPKVSKTSTVPVMGAYSSRMALYDPAITASCKNVETAARWIDYAFSKEGRINYLYGIEGVSYDMVDGKIKIKDIEMWKHSPDKSKYSYSNGFSAGFWDLVDETNKQLASPDDVDTTGWITEAPKYVIPEISMTEEEGKSVNEVMSEINSYVDGMHYKFVMGQEPLDKYDEYVAQIKKMGIDKAIQIYQAALDRYNKR